VRAHSYEFGAPDDASLPKKPGQKPGGVPPKNTRKRQPLAMPILDPRLALNRTHQNPPIGGSREVKVPYICVIRGSGVAQKYDYRQETDKDWSSDDWIDSTTDGILIAGSAKQSVEFPIADHIPLFISALDGLEIYFLVQ
jgi:hypothetical protein